MEIKCKRILLFRDGEVSSRENKKNARGTLHLKKRW
jgi:hypothetical protein